MDIYYKSDFTLIETFLDNNGVAIDMTAIDFKIDYYTLSNTKYTASKTGAVYVNCEAGSTTNQLNVFFAKHGMPAGKLQREITLYVTNPGFSPTQKVITNPISDIILVAKGGDSATASASVVYPAIVVPPTYYDIKDLTDSTGLRASWTAKIGIEDLQDATTKDAIIDADEVNYLDSEDDYSLVKTTWLNIKAKLKTYFDAIYEAILPSAPTNAARYYLNALKQWAEIAVGSGGYAANLYFTTKDSDVTGYKKIEYTFETAETELTGTITNQEVLFRTYLFDFPIETTIIDANQWVANFRTKVSTAAGTTQLKFEAFLYHEDTTETTLFSVYSDEINNTTYADIRTEKHQPSFTCLATDRLGVRIYGKTTHNAPVTIYTILGDGNASYFTTPLSIRHNQLRDLNGDDNYLHVTSTEKSTWNGKQDALTFSTDIEADKLSTTKVSAIKTFYDWAVGKFIDLSKIVTTWTATTLDANVPSEKLVKDSLNLKADITPTTGSTSALRALFTSVPRANCVYNTNTGYYEMNGITNLTELDVMKSYHFLYAYKNQTSGAYQGSGIRTNFYLDINSNTAYDSSYWFQNEPIELFKFYIYNSLVRTQGMFYSCPNLITAETFRMTSITLAINSLNMFYECVKLETVYLFQLKVAFSFAWSPLLSLASLQYLITNRANGTSRITITVHPTVWAKLNDAVNYPTWNALLVDAVNNQYIDFASA